MTKKNFLALADAIRKHNAETLRQPFNAEQVGVLADFCKKQNKSFNCDEFFARIICKEVKKR